MEIRAAVGEGRSIYTLTLLYYVLYVFILYSSTLPATLSMKAEGGRSAQRRTTAPFTASAPSLWGCGEGTILGHAAQACWGRSILLVPLVPTRTSSALLVPTEINLVGAEDHCPILGSRWTGLTVLDCPGANRSELAICALSHRRNVRRRIRRR